MRNILTIDVEEYYHVGRPGEGPDARELVSALEADVAAFSAGAEAADDLTILALRWRGPLPDVGARATAGT